MSIIYKFQSFENEHNPYAVGWNSAADNADKAARTLAFSAIRRAAEVARKYDAAAERAMGTNPFPDMDAAKGARRAIRAAIGSPKA